MGDAKSDDCVGLSRLIAKILSRVGVVNIHYLITHYFVVNDDDSLLRGDCKTTWMAHCVHVFEDRLLLQDQFITSRYCSRYQKCVISCHFSFQLFLLDRF